MPTQPSVPVERYVRGDVGCGGRESATGLRSGIALPAARPMDAVVTKEGTQQGWAGSLPGEAHSRSIGLDSSGLAGLLVVQVLIGSQCPISGPTKTIDGGFTHWLGRAPQTRLRDADESTNGGLGRQLAGG